VLRGVTQSPHTPAFVVLAIRQIWRTTLHYAEHLTVGCTSKLQSTDHELIPARNASLAAMQSYASGSNVRYYPTPLKERNEQGCYYAYN
jgi:hypothetical protein